MVFTVEQIDAIQEKAMAATEQIRAEFVSVEEHQKKREEQVAVIRAKLENKSEVKEVRIGIAIANLPICDDGKAKVGELVKIITGLDFEVPESIGSADEITQRHISFSILVPTKNDNGHDYSVNVSVMMIGPSNSGRGIHQEGGRGIRICGTIGNNLQWINSGLRPATDDEINTFFKIWRIMSEAGYEICAGYDLLGTEIKAKD